MIVKLLTEHHLEFLLLFRSILLKGMSNSIYNASASVFKDIIASPKMEKRICPP